MNRATVIVNTLFVILIIAGLLWFGMVTGIVSASSGQPPPMVQIENLDGCGWGTGHCITRIVDMDYSLVCYKTSNAISCVKMP